MKAYMMYEGDVAKVNIDDKRMYCKQQVKHTGVLNDPHVHQLVMLYL